ncbi:MAG: class I SAM-dependent methyltransferase, partial [Chloroflexota bacterium]
MDNPVRTYYEQSAEQEWERLIRPADGALEWTFTCRALSRYLPPEGRVLDIGGGPGRYTLWLAERGYRVVLADLSPALLEIARTQVADAGMSGRIEAIVEADARDLSPWADESFDAVLCLGPLY